MIAAVSWAQGQNVSVVRALRDMTEARIKLTATLHPRNVELQPRVVQIWFEPESRLVTGASTIRNPGQILTLPVSVKLDGAEIRWGVLTDRGQLRKLLGQRGRILVRVHCGHLMDERQRPFSASLDGVLGTESPRTPGGVHETWFFVGSG
jgi:hypothetical protein